MGCKVQKTPKCIVYTGNLPNSTNLKDEFLQNSNERYQQWTYPFLSLLESKFLDRLVQKVNILSLIIDAKSSFKELMSFSNFLLKKCMKIFDVQRNFEKVLSLSSRKLCESILKESKSVLCYFANFEVILKDKELRVSILLQYLIEFFHFMILKSNEESVFYEKNWWLPLSEKGYLMKIQINVKQIKENEEANKEKRLRSKRELSAITTV